MYLNRPTFQDLLVITYSKNARWRGGSNKSRNRTRMSIKGQSRTEQGKSKNVRVREIQREE